MVPCSYEELFRLPLLTAYIVKFLGRREEESVSEARQQVLLKAVRTGWLERYDPSRASFPTYLWWLVGTVVASMQRQRADVYHHSGARLLPVTETSAVDTGTELRFHARILAHQLHQRIPTQTRPIFWRLYHQKRVGRCQLQRLQVAVQDVSAR